jgi:hypothetical protein
MVEDDEERKALEVTCTQLPDGRWTARTRLHPKLVGVGQTSESAVRDLADAIDEMERDD